MTIVEIENSITRRVFCETNKATLQEMKEVVYNELGKAKQGTKERCSYEYRFINSIKDKEKLSAKQFNYLLKLGGMFGFSGVERSARKSATKRPTPRKCEHEDLGSRGYNHGETVKCPDCGQMTRVW